MRLVPHLVSCIKCALSNLFSDIQNEDDVPNNELCTTLPTTGDTVY